MPSVDQRLVLNKQLKTTCSFSTTNERKNEFAELNETPSDAPGICNSETDDLIKIRSKWLRLSLEEDDVLSLCIGGLAKR